MTDDIRIMVFVKALLPNSRLAFKLSRKNLASIEEMYFIAHEHMIAQELLSQRKTYVTRGPEQKTEQRRNPDP